MFTFKLQLEVLTELYNMADINSTENNLFTQRLELFFLLELV